MASKITACPGLSTRVVRCSGIEEAIDANPQAIFEEPAVLLIEGLSWDCDFDVFEAAKSDERKAFKAPRFSDRVPDSAVSAQITILEEQVSNIYARLYPDYHIIRHTTSWRNMQTIHDPMHFDSFDDRGASNVLGFVNLDSKPRVWRVSYTLQDLLQSMPRRVGRAWNDALQTGSWKRYFSIALRDKPGSHTTIFGKSIPYHEIAFTQGAFWVVDPKTVMHQIYWGNNVFMYSNFCQSPPTGILHEDILNRFFQEI